LGAPAWHETQTVIACPLSPVPSATTPFASTVTPVIAVPGGTCS
jgi:hypothetical protein